MKFRHREYLSDMLYCEGYRSPIDYRTPVEPWRDYSSFLKYPFGTTTIPRGVTEKRSRSATGLIPISV